MYVDPLPCTLHIIGFLFFFYTFCCDGTGVRRRPPSACVDHPTAPRLASIPLFISRRFIVNLYKSCISQSPRACLVSLLDEM
jgi:hypothetical protein